MTRRTQAPLHERLPPLGWIRGALRRRLFSFLESLGDTDEFRALVERHGARTAAPPLPPTLTRAAVYERPYDDLGRAHPPAPSAGADPVIVTARYRSGSTLLWNLFRQHDEFTAYYEPLNPRRWFDPAARGHRVDESHRGVADYWREYEGAEALGESFDDGWYRERLFIPEDGWAPRLRAYVEGLIRHAPARPLLQFNLIDLRLPWFRRNFPHAKIVHLYRHPRETWCSTLGSAGGESCGPDASMRDFADGDRFYLRTWCRDLRYRFPLLDEASADHPYDLHYALWLLSYLFGCAYADFALSYEELTRRPADEIAKLLTALEASTDATEHLAALVTPTSPRRWPDYASASWFSEREARCEEVLLRSLGGVAAGGS